MRFTRGSKIEVFSKRDVPLGSWRPAEIISGNGHAYTVRYDRYSAGEPESVVGWVSWSSIRPCPPVEVTIWLSGDIVEVLHNFSWKLATILKGFGNKQVLVRLIGSLEELTVDLDDIRVRQSWEDNKWIVMGKRSLTNKEAKHQDTMAGSAHGLKRISLNWHAQCESTEAAAKKYRRVEKCGQIYRVVDNPSLPSEHRCSLDPHCKLEGKKDRRTSLIIRFPAILRRSQITQRFDSSSVVSYSDDEDDSDLCSVGSCSTSDSCGQINYGLANDSNSDHSDTESSNASSHDKRNHIHKSQEEAVIARIHELEIHAYRSTLRALHASGPISWEQESLISNLRLSLNISNDEHLMELKSLLSNDH